MPPDPSDGPTVLILAGEPSGDAHAAEVARELRLREPGVRLLGLGGASMEAAGVELLAGLDELAVMGFFEVLPRLPFFWRLERRLTSLMEGGEVDLVIPVDYPGFNLRMTRRAHRRGIPVLYYIGPQVWAWKARRAERLARESDHIAVILPFEEEIFARLGGSVSFVGHPLVDRADDLPGRDSFCAAVRVSVDAELLALLPGSRKQELDRHLELFVEVAKRLRRKRATLQPVLAAAPSVDRERLEETGLPVTADFRTLLRHAHVALVKSGTSTLEAALAGTPFVMAYRTNPLTFALAKRLVKVDHVALVNLVAGTRLVPELLQDDATPERLLAHLEPLVDADSGERRAMLEGLGRVRTRLGRPGAARRVAEIAHGLLNQGSGSVTEGGAEEGV